jgi:hypothetical protein
MNINIFAYIMASALQLGTCIIDINFQLMVFLYQGASDFLNWAQTFSQGIVPTLVIYKY